MSAKGRGLGKGLGALFSEFEEEYDAALKSDKSEKPAEGAEKSVLTDTPSSYRETKREDVAATPANDVVKIKIEKIFPNINQPRKNFNDEKLKELAASIKLHGVIQPIILTNDDGRYMIIAGERRYRASILAGLSEIPAIVRDYTPLQVKEISLIENLQREDLNPIEAANAIRQLMTEYHFTQEDIAERIGKSRSAVANSLRLLTLSPEVAGLVATDRLSAGHARALVVIENKDYQYKLAMQAADNKMSVRDLEKAVKKYTKPDFDKPKQELSLELKDLISEMQRVFATKVGAIGNERRGRIYIDYYTSDDLDRIAELLTLWKRENSD